MLTDNYFAHRLLPMRSNLAIAAFLFNSIKLNKGAALC